MLYDKKETKKTQMKFMIGLLKTWDDEKIGNEKKENLGVSDEMRSTNGGLRERK